MALEGELRLFGIMRSMMRSMMETVDSEQLYEMPAGGGNSPGWIVGHLTLGSWFGVALLDGREIDENLLKHYGPGSASDVPVDQRLEKADLLAEEQEAADAFLAAIEAADPAAFDKPQQTGILEKAFPTVGNMLSHLLASHYSMHTGQLSAWRRNRGMPSILKL